MKQLYPLFVDLDGCAVVVIGGGEVAQRKVAALRETGAYITVVSPEVTEELRQWAENKQIYWRQRRYYDGDLAGARLVIAATDDAVINELVREEADDRGIFCNVVDVPKLCSFQVPAVVRRGPLQVAVSTGGVCPYLAKLLKHDLEDYFGPRYEELVKVLGQLRDYGRQRYPEDQVKRMELMDGFVADGGVTAFKEGDYERFHQIAAKWLGQ